VGVQESEGIQIDRPDRGEFLLRLDSTSQNDILPNKHQQVSIECYWDIQIPFC